MRRLTDTPASGWQIPVDNGARSEVRDGILAQAHGDGKGHDMICRHRSHSGGEDTKIEGYLNMIGSSKL